jgi:hypothetical protein
MLNLARMDDAAATPLGFGIFEDFVSQRALAITDETGATAVAALAEVTTPTDTPADADALRDDLAATSIVDINTNFASIASKMNVSGASLLFTTVGSGTVATSAANGGWIKISGVLETDNSGGQIQAEGMHACTQGKRIRFKARGKLNEETSANVATQSDFAIGLFPVDTTIVGAGGQTNYPANGAHFRKTDGATSIICEVRANSATPVFSTTLASTIVADTSIHTYGIEIIPGPTGKHEVYFFVDGVLVASYLPTLAATSLPATDVFLAPSLAFQSGDDTGTKWFECDYIGSYQDR